MIFKLHSKALDNFNKRAYELLSLMVEKPTPINEEAEPLKGSRGEKPAWDITDKMVDSPAMWYRTKNGSRVDIFQSYKGIDTGIEESNYPNYIKLVEGLWKSKEISEKITKDFIYDHLFKWLIKTYKAKRAECDFLQYLQDKATEASSDYNYAFKVLNLSIEKRFKIGKVEFDYIDEAFFDKMSERIPGEIEAMKERMLGEVYATYAIKDVHKEKGIEIALAECYKAMNVLKLFCRTVFVPDYHTTFDIDTRVGVTGKFEYMIKDLKADEEFQMTMGGGDVHALEEETIEGIVNANRNFEWLILVEEPNEYQRLLLNAIDKFAHAISNIDLNRRLVDLFTIWESLLLKNDTVYIQDSLIYYGHELAHPEENFKDFSSFILGLYAIRSALVHHATNKNINLEALRKFQLYTIQLLETMINCRTCTSKILLLEAVDRKLGKSVEMYSEERKAEST